jgi:hypothetical protein
MTFTDYAGLVGLVAAAALALHMLRGPHTPPTARHRGARQLRRPHK